MKLTVYDNGGETVDRYTVVLPNNDIYAMSSDSTSPLGVNQFIGDLAEFGPLKFSGEEVHPTPDCVILGLRQHGYSSALIYDWVVETDKEYWLNECELRLNKQEVVD